jgi:hypothetical protein
VGVGNERRSQHELTRFGFDQVDQTRVASGDLRCEPDNLTQHLVQRQFGAYYPAHSVQNGDIGILRFHCIYDYHTSEVKASGSRGPIKSFYGFNL